MERDEHVVVHAGAKEGEVPEEEVEGPAAVALRPLCALARAVPRHVRQKETPRGRNHLKRQFFWLVAISKLLVGKIR